MFRTSLASTIKASSKIPEQRACSIKNPDRRLTHVQLSRKISARPLLFQFFVAVLDTDTSSAHRFVEWPFFRSDILQKASVHSA